MPTVLYLLKLANKVTHAHTALLRSSELALLRSEHARRNHKAGVCWTPTTKQGTVHTLHRYLPSDVPKVAELCEAVSRRAVDC